MNVAFQVKENCCCDRVEALQAGKIILKHEGGITLPQQPLREGDAKQNDKLECCSLKTEEEAGRKKKCQQPLGPEKGEA